MYSLRVLLASTLIIFSVSSCAAEKPKAPNETTLLSTYAGPSIVYIATTFKGTVLDPGNDLFIPTRFNVKSGKLGKAKTFEVTASCTGFVVNTNGHISTAGHCVDPKEAEEGIKKAAAAWALEIGLYDVGADKTVEALIEENRFKVETADTESREEGADRGTITVGTGPSADQQHKARLLKFRPASKGDTAILKIDETDLLALKVASSNELDVGTEVVSIGYPAKVDEAVDPDYNPSYKDGEISSKKTREGGLFSVFEVSSALSGGMSGGPTATLNGDIVGFNSFIAADDVQESEQFGFIGTSDLILELMNDVGVKNDVGDLGRTYKAGLDAYFDGDKEKAVEALQTVVDEGPENETTKEYLTKAKKLPDPFPIALVVGLAVVGLVLATIVGLLLVRRRRSRGGSPGQSATSTEASLSDSHAPAAIEPTPAPGHGYCSSCGSPINPNAKFCPSCGTPVTPTN